MKTVIGVDTPGYYKPAMTLFKRLEFADPEIHLVNVIESLFPDGSFPPMTAVHPVATYRIQREEEGTRELAAAAAYLAAPEDRLTKEIRQGDPARVLIEHADDVSADLIVAGSAQKGAFGSLFFGSVAKGLVIGAHQSVLIGKAGPKPHGSVTAVLATDHSDYMNRCIDRLIAAAPRGLSRIVVLTATRVSRGAAGQLLLDLPELTEAGPGWVHEKLKERNEPVCERLRALGLQCESRLEEAHPNEAIQNVMKETEADLLILGAQGHGFWDRLAIGSISFQQAIAEPHSVLLLRV